MSASPSPANLSPTNSASSASQLGTSPPRPETLSPKAAHQPSSPKAGSSPRPALLSNQPARRSFLGRVARSGLPGINLRRHKGAIKLEEGVDPNAAAVGWLVVQVLAGRDLVAKDKNGLSDPFVNIRYGATRVTSPTVAKSLNPSWEANGAGEAKLEAKVYDSRNLGRQPVEILIWDKDRVGKEYLGELSLGLHDWWGPRDSWHDNAPPIGFSDDDNKPIWYRIRSSRARSHVSGELLVKVGFLPLIAGPATAPPTPSSPASAEVAGDNKNEDRHLSEADRTRLLEILRRVAEEEEGTRRASKEERVLLSPPTEGVGMHPISDVHPLGETEALDALEGDSSSGSETDGAETDSEGSTTTEEDDNERAIAETSTDDEAGAPSAPAPDYFAHSASPLPPLDTDAPPAQPGSKPLSPVLEPGAEPVTVPDIVVGQDEATPVTTPRLGGLGPAAAIPPSRRGLSLPGFLRRNSSSRSVSSANVSANEGVESGESGVTATGRHKMKRRFSRKKEAAVLDGDVSGEASSSSLAKAPKLRKHRRKHRADRKSDASGGAGEGSSDKPKRKKLGKRRTSHYTYEDDDDVLGLVQIEINSANLPRFSNMFKTGFDCDPFVVVSFGKTIARTRVIRHDLTPTWNEKVYFTVKELEANYTITFSVYDWDKLSSNDHLGDVALPLKDLLGNTIKPDDRGLYACDPDSGKLVGDDFHEGALPLVVGDKAPAGDYKLNVRAKFTPYDALRQSFFRALGKNFDLDESGAFSPLEVFSVLDALGSTLSRETVDGFYERFGKTPSEELTADELVVCLEAEIHKKRNEKRQVDEAGTPSGLNTPATESSLLGLMGGEVGQSQVDEPQDYSPTDLDQAKTDPSSNMRTLAPAEEAVTNPEQGTVVQVGDQTADGGRVKPVRSVTQGSVSDELSGLEEGGVERLVNIKECPLCHKPRMRSKGELDIITHLAICASTDPRSVNRMVVTNSFVTGSQAQRKWITKVISNVTKGSYQLGANSANIIVQDRETGALMEEKMAVYVRLGIRLMYKGMGSKGGIEGARVKRMLETLSKKQGVKFDSPSSAREIEPFIRFHNLNSDEILDPLESFKTFNQFFYRKLKPSARPVADPDDPRTLVSPADCRAMFFESVEMAKTLWIKGRDFSVQKLLGDKFADQAAKYEGGSLCIFRLAPQDYHRYHSPVDGVMGPEERISGKYYTVNPMAIRSAIDVYGENTRVVSPTHSPVFGDVFQCWIGAMMVGSIIQEVHEGDEVRRGDPVGYFAFGGSTIVALFEPGKVKFDEDLVNNSKASLETLIRMGTRIGRAVA